MKIVLGGPGCGKTTYLLSEVEVELQSETPPNEIAFVAFTRKAAHEARERAIDKFGYTEDEMPYFRTLHSFAFRQLGLAASEVMAKKDFEIIGESIGRKFGAFDEETGLPVGDKESDQIAYIDQLARLQERSIESVCQDLQLVSPYAVLDYSKALERYKRERHMLDFTDMLVRFLHESDVPKLRAAFIDEAQDLSPLQWRVAWKIAQRADRVWVAGDDDQAIYEWSGADVQTFLKLQGDFHVLPKSHRLPRNIFNYSRGILSRIQARFEKQYEPANEGGIILQYSDPLSIDMREGSWYLLARNRYLTSHYVETVETKGYPYVMWGKSSTDNDNVRALLYWEALRRGKTLEAEQTKILYSRLRAAGVKDGMRQGSLLVKEQLYNYDLLVKEHGLLVPKEESWMEAVRMPAKDREYYRQILANKESLINWPRITIGTIHGVKGGEADNVVVCPDFSYSCKRNYENNPDSEHRVFYVGVTRAKKALYILDPRTTKYYELR